MEEKSIIQINSDGWSALLSEIASSYSDGTVIPHEWLKERFGFKELRLEDYESVSDFLQARDEQQFSYMTLVVQLHKHLLEDYKMCTRNIRGDGYQIIKSEEQAQYGFDNLLSDVRKAFREAELIVNNVMPVDMEQQAKDNDIRAKIGMMKQMFAGIRK